jgi:sugar/nucleoside kinase (ribokinase family)
MLTHDYRTETPALSGPLPDARIYFEVVQHDAENVLTGPRPAGSLLVRDSLWDPQECWSAAALARVDGADVFILNDVEAKAFTGTTTALAAARALSARAPLVIVKCGAQGAIAVDSGSGTVESVPAYTVPSVDTTGAGDVFGASFMIATLYGWPLRDRVSFACLCASISVTGLGGAVSAPDWSDIAGALRRMDDETRDRYRFLAEHPLPPSIGNPTTPAAAASRG